MANDYTGIKKVRAHNGNQFIEDFMKVNTVVVMAIGTNIFLNVQKQDVWRHARESKIGYLMSKEVFKNNCLVMVIV